MDILRTGYYRGQRNAHCRKRFWGWAFRRFGDGEDYTSHFGSWVRQRSSSINRGEHMSLRPILSVLVFLALAGGANAQNNVVIVYPPPEPQPDMVIFRTRMVPAAADQQPGIRQTTFIAFQNSVVRLVDQYWVSGNTLHYVTADHQEMSAPLSSVDRALSERLNSEQNVSFSLPAERERAIVQVQLTRTRTVSVHKQCCCVSTPSARALSGAGGRASRAGSAARTGK
jgi:hypothetical protein